MSRVTDGLRAIWSSTFGLLVEDGALALGAIAALAITWSVAAATPGGFGVHAGWLLLALVLGLVLWNLVAAARNARRRIS